MKSHRIPSLLPLACMALTAGSAHAAVLASYDINSILSPTADSAGATGLTASSLTTTASGVSTNFRWLGTHVPYHLNANVNDGTTPTVTDIVATWNLTPTAGQQITIDTTGGVGFGLLAFSGQQDEGNSYSVYGRVFIASDAVFTNILATSTILSDTEDDETSRNPSNITSDQTVGTVDFDASVTSSSTLYFGFAFLEDLSNSSIVSTNARYDGFEVNGSVAAIPEPSAALLGGLGMLALLRRRR